MDDESLCFEQDECYVYYIRDRDAATLSVVIDTSMLAVGQVLCAASVLKALDLASVLSALSISITRWQIVSAS